MMLNAAPIFEGIGDREINETKLVEFSIRANDPDGPNSELRYEIVNGPEGATIDPISGRFQWTPEESAGGFTFNIDVVVTDTGGLSDNERFRIQVNDFNLPPRLAPIEDFTIEVGELLEVRPVATDPDLPRDDLTITLEQGPQGATLDDDGVIRWTPPFGFTLGHSHLLFALKMATGGSIVNFPSRCQQSFRSSLQSDC